VIRPAKRVRGANSQKVAFEKRKSVSAKAASVNDENEDEDEDEDEGLFFTKSKFKSYSSPIAEQSTPEESFPKMLRWTRERVLQSVERFIFFARV